MGVRSYLLTSPGSPSSKWGLIFRHKMEKWLCSRPQNRCFFWVPFHMVPNLGSWTDTRKYFNSSFGTRLQILEIHLKIRPFWCSGCPYFARQACEGSCMWFFVKTKKNPICLVKKKRRDWPCLRICLLKFTSLWPHCSILWGCSNTQDSSGKWSGKS